MTTLTDMIVSTDLPVSLRHHRRLTAVPGRDGLFVIRGYYATATGCTCPRGASGCEHSAVARVILAGPVQRQAEMQQQDREAPAAPAGVLTLDAAAQLLDVKPATVRRYLRAGKLTRQSDGIAAASVDAYQARRTANLERTRGRSETSRAIEAAKRDQERAAALERKAAKLRKSVRATYEQFGAGRHDDWMLEQGPSVDVAAHTRAGSWRATRLAA